MKIDFKKFQGVLPYASELYGVYQPLIGWRSRRIQDRVQSGLNTIKNQFVGSLLTQFIPSVHQEGGPAVPPSIETTLGIADLASSKAEYVPQIDSHVARKALATIQQFGVDTLDAWKAALSRSSLEAALKAVEKEIGSDLRPGLMIPDYSRATFAAGIQVVPASEQKQVGAELASILTRESKVAGLLAFLGETFLDRPNGQEQIKGLLFAQGEKPPIHHAVDLWSNLDPRASQLTHAIISPIGIVHVFNQYFFEFDTFLGTPVQHIWLSPGGTVELVEVSTRKTVIERTMESAFETQEKTEKSSMVQDELSDAIRSENSSNTKLGVSLNTSTQFGNAKIFTAQANTSASFGLESSQKGAREQTHKGLRQQTEKVATEVRRSYKSTFRTVTETTDTTSRRYVIQNTTDKLVNYELRRKMRQVGVQVQDYGTSLCWQTYVDNPAEQLGVALFVHVAELPDLRNIAIPEEVPQPEPLVRGQPVPYKAKVYLGEFVSELIPFFPPISIVPPQHGYIYDHAEVRILSGEPWAIYAWPSSPTDNGLPWPWPNHDARTEGYIVEIDDGKGGTEPSVRKIQPVLYLKEGGQDETFEWALEIIPIFKPSQALIKQVNDANAQNRTKATNEAQFKYQEALFKAVRERVKLASNIQPRKFEELREEERTVVYRMLIKQLSTGLKVGLSDERAHHVFAELISSMFDVDNMLYFVAPEWWMPREHTTAMQNLRGLGITSKYEQSFGQIDVVSWGGAKAVRPDNYYITEDSTPAKLGSSLGWLIQLDGDNLRNAFLNAPWVKAVIPIRPGSEWNTLDWLTSIEGNDGLGDGYAAADPAEKQVMLAALRNYRWKPGDPLETRYATLKPEDITILDAIRYLIINVQRKFEKSRELDQSVGSLPTDKVFEHGFDPLQGGFKIDSPDLEVFTQWVEILPTDQIVAVEAQYDPKTGLQI